MASTNEAAGIDRICPVCGARAPIGKPFCADCGASLTAEIDTIRAVVDERISARFKDQKLIEVETAQAVVERIATWAKLFGAFVAIPLALLAAVFGLFGYRQFSDFEKMLDVTKKELTTQISGAKEDFEKAVQTARDTRNEAVKMQAEVAELRTMLDKSQISGLRTEIEQLSSRVKGIEQRFKIDPSGVSGDLSRTLTQSLAQFAAYLEQCGFDTRKSPAVVQIAGSDLNSTYSIEDKRVVVGKPLADATALAKDPSMLIWPYVQHVLSTANGAAINSASPATAAIVNAIPDYYVASYRNDPKIGAGFPGLEATNQKYLRNLDNEFQFGTRREPHEVGEVWGGIFWKIRAEIGPQGADQLLRMVWMQSTPAELSDKTGAAFAARLVGTLEKQHGSAHAASIRSDIERRGMRIAR